MVYSNNKLHADLFFFYCSKGNSAVSDWHYFKIFDFQQEKNMQLQKPKQSKKLSNCTCWNGDKPKCTSLPDPLTTRRALGHAMNDFAD